MGNAQIVSTLPHRTIQPQLLQSPAVDMTAVDYYWMKFLGCSRSQFYLARDTLIFPSPAVDGLWALARQGNWIIAAPPHWCNTIGNELMRCFRPHTLPNQQDLQQLIGGFPEQQIYGPGLVFLHDQPLLPQIPAVTIRPLTSYDAQAVSAFAAAASPTPIPWTLGEPDVWIKIWGLFFEDQLVSSCAVRVWGKMLAEVYVDTSPAYRCRGFGKAVTYAALDWIATATPYHAESVVELSNTASVKLLRRLGGKPYAYMVMSYADVER